LTGSNSDGSPSSESSVILLDFSPFSYKSDAFSKAS
jgi:hypothetical protein